LSCTWLITSASAQTRADLQHLWPLLWRIDMHMVPWRHAHVAIKAEQGRAPLFAAFVSARHATGCWCRTRAASGCACVTPAALSAPRGDKDGEQRSSALFALDGDLHAPLGRPCLYMPAEQGHRCRTMLIVPFVYRRETAGERPRSDAVCRTHALHAVTPG